MSDAHWPPVLARHTVHMAPTKSPPPTPPTPAATPTVKIDAATLRKLVVSTVVTVDDSGEEGADKSSSEGDAVWASDEPKKKKR